MLRIDAEMGYATIKRDNVKKSSKFLSSKKIDTFIKPEKYAPALLIRQIYIYGCFNLPIIIIKTQQINRRTISTGKKFHQNNIFI